MPKTFEKIGFDFDKFKNEVKDLEKLLQSKAELKERKDILPFFNENKILTSQIATFLPYLDSPNSIAFEYDIFGDFVCDVAIGNSSENIYCFLEFEDATKYSLFKKSGKYQPAFSSRFEQGYSQILDWFTKIEGQSSIEKFNRFGSITINYHGFLIIGRDKFTDPRLSNRIKWREKNVIINNKNIYISTFDNIFRLLQTKIKIIETYRK